MYPKRELSSCSHLLHFRDLHDTHYSLEPSRQFGGPRILRPPIGPPSRPILSRAFRLGGPVRWLSWPWIYFEQRVACNFRSEEHIPVSFVLSFHWDEVLGRRGDRYVHVEVDEYEIHGSLQLRFPSRRLRRWTRGCSLRVGHPWSPA